ncbi:MAG: Uma2 family endonuclease [Terriglobia bacterium]|jgi:Uma2 family endonuclease
MATKTLLTVEEFMRLPESVGERDVRYELVEGELIEMSPAMLRHNLVRDRALVSLKVAVDKGNLGTVVSEQPFHLFGTTVRVPDVAFVRRGRELPLDRLPQGAPDLVVEVVSPSNTPREIEQRISDYFAGGCKRVWVFHPEHREVYIHGLAGVTRRKAEEMLEDAELLPGFSAKVSEFFVEND